MTNAKFQKISEIGITCFNIHGIFQKINNFRYNKLVHPYVQNLYEKYKIVCLIETHHEQGHISDLQVQNFKCHSKCRPKSKKKPHTLDSNLFDIYSSIFIVFIYFIGL